MILSNGFVINSYHELVPDYKISPFSAGDIARNRKLPFSNTIDDFFKNKFGDENYIYTINAREAIYLALEHFNLKNTDCVTILTTTNNFYISSCVTHEIEKFCEWSRKMEDNTKVIFVNHEFGYPYEGLAELKKYNLPIIEDCAFSFFSTDKKNQTGKVGDFVIYSFPKMFPIQLGGLLKCNLPTSLIEVLDQNIKRYVKNVLSHYVNFSNEIIGRRKENYLLLNDVFKDIGIGPRFLHDEEYVPGVYMFKSARPIDYKELKTFMIKNGVQCSVFYGEESFFIPVHQNLEPEDINYFQTLIKFFLENT